MEGFPHDPPVAVHPHQVRAHQAGSRLHHIALGVEQDGPQEFFDAAERLVPGVGQLVVAALTAMQLDDLALSAVHRANPGLALSALKLEGPAWFAAGSELSSSQSRSPPRPVCVSSRQGWT